MAIRESSESLVEAEAAFDVVDVVNYFAEDAIVQPSNSPQIQGKASITKMYQQFFSMEQLKEFHAVGGDIIISESGDFAYQLGTNRTILDSDNGPQELNGHWMIVWKKIKGKWLVAVMTLSYIASEGITSNGNRTIH
jgi:ketosteroid isomerase-like protein